MCDVDEQSVEIDLSEREIAPEAGLSYRWIFLDTHGNEGKERKMWCSMRSVNAPARSRCVSAMVCPFIRPRAWNRRPPQFHSRLLPRCCRGRSDPLQAGDGEEGEVSTSIDTEGGDDDTEDQDEVSEGAP